MTSVTVNIIRHMQLNHNFLRLSMDFCNILMWLANFWYDFVLHLKFMIMIVQGKTYIWKENRFSACLLSGFDQRLLLFYNNYQLNLSQFAFIHC